MLRSIVLLAVVYMATASEPQAPTFPGLRTIAEPRLMSSGIRIGRLERVIKDLKHELEEAAKIDPQGVINEANRRIEDAQPPRCPHPKHEIPCGRDSAECVSTLLLCDGHDDCHNGYDEDSHTCSVGPIVAGSVFSGTATWHNCRLRKEHPVQLQITAVVKPKFFGARLAVRGRISADYVDHGHDDEPQHVHYDLKGYYVFGIKRLVLIPLEATNEHIGVVCTWNHGDDDRAECKLVHEATLGECADFFVTHQH